jgi:outer membrane protein TolC
MMKWLIGTLLLMPGAAALAQTPTAAKPAENWQTTFFEAPTVAIPQLMAAAIRHSAAVKSIGIEQSINKEDLKIAQKNILNSIALGGSYTYGNLSSIGGLQVDPVTNTPIGLNTYSSGRYFAGVNLAMPIDRLVTRGNLIRKERLNLERTQSVQKEREDVIRQQVITLYQNVLLTRKLLTLRQESYVNAQSSYRIAEKQFRQGQLVLTEFNQASSLLTDVNIAQEAARNQYDTAFMLLEEFVGEKIATIIK